MIDFIHINYSIFIITNLNKRKKIDVILKKIITHTNDQINSFPLKCWKLIGAIKPEGQIDLAQSL